MADALDPCGNLPLGKSKIQLMSHPTTTEMNVRDFSAKSLPNIMNLKMLETYNVLSFVQTKTLDEHTCFHLVERNMGFFLTKGKYGQTYEESRVKLFPYKNLRETRIWKTWVQPFTQFILILRKYCDEYVMTSIFESKSRPSNYILLLEGNSHITCFSRKLLSISLTFLQSNFQKKKNTVSLLLLEKLWMKLNLFNWLC